MRTELFLIGKSPPLMRNGPFLIRRSQNQMRTELFLIGKSRP